MNRRDNERNNQANHAARVPDHIINLVRPDEENLPEKLSAYRAMLAEGVTLLCTPPPTVKDQHGHSASINIRELPANMEILEGLWENAPSGIYPHRSDMYRCIFRIGTYVATRVFQHMLPDRYRLLEDIETLQLKILQLTRDERHVELDKAFEQLRQRIIANNREPVDKLQELDEVLDTYWQVIEPNFEFARGEERGEQISWTMEAMENEIDVNIAEMD